MNFCPVHVRVLPGCNVPSKTIFPSIVTRSQHVFKKCSERFSGALGVAVGPGDISGDATLLDVVSACAPVVVATVVTEADVLTRVGDKVGMGVTVGIAGIVDWNERTVDTGAA